MSNNRLGGVLFLLLFSAYGFYAGDIPLDYWSEQELFNARSMPYFVALAGGICACLLILVPAPKTDWSSNLNLNWLPACILLLLMSLYGFLLEPLGFVVATVLFLVGAFVALGIKSLQRPIVVALSISVSFWLLMDVLGIYLSPGALLEQLLQYLGVER